MLRKRFIHKQIISISTFLLIFINTHITFAAEVSIADGITTNTSSVSDNATILFTGNNSGILNHDTTSAKPLGNITTNNHGIGTLNIASGGTGSLTISGNIGSATKNIENIIFNEATVLTVNGSIYAQNGITTNGVGGDLNLEGAGIAVVGNVGGATNKLDGIVVLTNGDTTFYGSIFTDSLTINSGGVATLSEDSNTTFLTTSSASTLNIAAGKQLTISNAATISDTTLGITIDSSVSSAPSITSSADITIANDTTLSFDYSNSSHLKSGDSYNFITTTETLTNNSPTITDNSFLLSPTIAVADNTSLQITQNIDNAATTQLDTSNNELVNFLIYNTQDNSDSDLAQTTILKMSSKAEVENALDNLSDTLQIDKNNLIQKTSSDISNAINNSIDDRLQLINYNQFRDFNKKRFIFIKNGKKIKNKSLVTKHNKFWSKIFGGDSKMSNTKNSTATKVKGYDASFAGVSFGVDKIIKGKKINAILGGALSYGGANGESKSLSNKKTNIESYNFSLYNHNIRKNGLGFFNENILGIGYNKYDSSKIIKIDSSYQSKSKSEFSGIQYNAKIGIGYNFKVKNKTIFSPIASINYFGLQLQDYQEDNTGGLGLEVKNNNFNLLASEVGFRIIGDINATIKPQLNISWLYNLKTKGSKSNSTSSNINDSQYYSDNRGSNIDKNILNAGVQLNLTTGKNTSVALKYDLQKSSNFTSHLGSASFGWKF